MFKVLFACLILLSFQAMLCLSVNPTEQDKPEIQSSVQNKNNSRNRLSLNSIIRRNVSLAELSFHDSALVRICLAYIFVLPVVPN